MVNDSALLTPSDVVHMVHEEADLRVSTAAVRRWHKQGLLKAERTVGGVFLFRAGDVRRFLNRRREQRELRERRLRDELAS